MRRGLFNPERTPERACLRPDQWPETFRSRWCEAIAPGDIIDGSGALAHLRPISIRKLESGFGRFLTFVARNPEHQWPSRSEEDARDVLRAYLGELEALNNRPYTILARLQELRMVLCVLEPDRDWAFLTTAMSRIRRTATSTAASTTLAGAHEVLEVGLTAMRNAAEIKNSLKSATTFRDGLLVAFLALRPLRRKNLAAFELGRTLLRTGSSYDLVIPGEEMKGRAPLEMTWPAQLEEHLETWLTVHRPVLLQQRGRWYQPPGAMLWISSHGSPMTIQAIYDRIVRLTEKALDRISPHQFRSIAASTFINADPEHACAAAPLLAHRSYATTYKYYLRACAADAVRRHQELVQRLRSKRS
jgi:hypothetical protein